MKKYICLLDTETTNTFNDEKGNLDISSGLIYNIAWIITDLMGNIIKSGNYLVRDVFYLEKELMKSAYYAEKIPEYWNEFKVDKTIKMANFLTIRKLLLNDLKDYNVTEVYAHNANFDFTVLNTTLRYLTKSRYHYFMPKRIIACDTMKMASATICKQKQYKDYCVANSYLTANGRVRKTAEILYRYIHKDETFVEEHKALEDILAERDIFVACRNTHLKTNRFLYKDKPIPTLQWELVGKDLVKNYHRELTKSLPNKKLPSKKYVKKGMNAIND